MIAGGVPIYMFGWYSLIFGSVRVIFGSAQLSSGYLRKASGEHHPSSKYLGLPSVDTSAFALTSDIFVVYCTRVSNLHSCYMKTAFLFSRSESCDFFKLFIKLVLYLPFFSNKATTTTTLWDSFGTTSKYFALRLQK